MCGLVTRMAMGIAVLPNPKVKIVAKRPLANGVTAFVVTVTKPVEMPEHVAPHLMRQLVPTAQRPMKTDVSSVRKKNYLNQQKHVIKLTMNVLHGVPIVMVCVMRRLDVRNMNPWNTLIMDAEKVMRFIIVKLNFGIPMLIVGDHMDMKRVGVLNYKKGAKRLLFLFLFLTQHFRVLQQITASPNRADIIIATGCFFQLFTQLANKHVNNF